MISQQNLIKIVRTLPILFLLLSFHKSAVLVVPRGLALRTKAHRGDFLKRCEKSCWEVKFGNYGDFDVIKDV